VLLLCLLVAGVYSFGVLGGDLSSVEADRVHVNANSHITMRQNYTVHELQSPAGTVVREYASPSGRVFAVAWQGPAMPDMKQLLGSHFEEFQRAAEVQNRRGGHGPLIIQHPRLVVELGGHMRSFVGRAYLPDEVPSEVANEEIR
jgi:hypothetical protein